jgi:hypothetical protein
LVKKVQSSAEIIEEIMAEAHAILDKLGGFSC